MKVLEQRDGVWHVCMSCWCCGWTLDAAMAFSWRDVMGLLWPWTDAEGDAALEASKARHFAMLDERSKQPYTGPSLEDMLGPAWSTANVMKRMEARL